MGGRNCYLNSIIIISGQRKTNSRVQEEISVSLSIQEGQPEISIFKQGKPLKSIPTKYKKDPQITLLNDPRISEKTKQVILSRIQLLYPQTKFSK
jgi:hypothetical protein